MALVTLDTETVGLFGMPVLLQYSIDDGPVLLYDIWREPIKKTLDLIEWICDHDVLGFNIVFDWFHISKVYTTFWKYVQLGGGLYDIPEDHINRMAEVERDAWDGPCVKPRRACDVFLHARKGPYQSLMARKDIKISRVPIDIAPLLVEELRHRIEIDDIYFSRRHNAEQWTIYDTNVPDFKNVILKFSASSALKVLAEHVLKRKRDDILLFRDIEPDKKWRPKESGWAPFALAMSTPEKGWRVWKKGKVKPVGKAWPGVIKHHINHWAFYQPARIYAGDDVRYTRELWQHEVFGAPEPGDDDSTLACMVASVRWHGMSVDIPAMKEQRRLANESIKDAPIKPSAAKEYIGASMSPAMLTTFTSTKRQILEGLDRDLKCDCQLTQSLGDYGDFDFEITEEPTGPCPICGGTGRHPAADRAKEVLTARKAKKEIEVYDKIIQAGRFYPSFVIIGTLSSRMAGTDGLNAQGIGSKTEIRECFGFADPGFVLTGGDFDSFEVVIADSVYDDPALRAALQTVVPCARCNVTGFIEKKGKTIKCDICEGKKYTSQKVHALFAMELYPGDSYDDIIMSKGAPQDKYKTGKAGFLSQMYGGDWNTLVKKNAVQPEVAQAAEHRFMNKYVGIKRARDRINDDFCSMRQPEGTHVYWNDPAESISSLFGFKRYFTLENKIVKELFTLANAIPKSWPKTKVERQLGRTQTASGAASSSLYGAAFGIQGCNMRAAANHVIQSSGATITKTVQRKVWDLQPHGVNEWRLYGINIHDELMICVRPEWVDSVADIVNNTVESFRERVPLIKFEFQKYMKNWASK
jgi:hypothetical protein